MSSWALVSTAVWRAHHIIRGHRFCICGLPNMLQEEANGIARVSYYRTRFIPLFFTENLWKKSPKPRALEIKFYFDCIFKILYKFLLLYKKKTDHVYYIANIYYILNVFNI